MNYAKTILANSIAMILLCAMNSYAEDGSGLFFDLLTTNPPNTSIVIASPAGEKTGMNILAGSINDVSSYVQEIPNSYAGYEASPMNNETGAAADTGHVSVQIFNHVVPGNYNVSIYASTTTVYRLSVDLRNTTGQFIGAFTVSGLISAAGAAQYGMALNPTPGAPAPVITKTVTFDVLRNDVSVAQKLSQLGDDKFAAKVVRNINLAEKLAGVCGKRKAKKDKCEPAVNALRLFVKRLELANRKCDNPADCDEAKDLSAFRKAHGKDHDYDDFFKDSDKKEKPAKRFIADEALGIIKSDAEVLIKQYGGEVKK